LQEFMAFITHLKDEPLALILFGIMLLYKTVESFAKHTWPNLSATLFKKGKKKSIEEILSEEAQARKKRHEEIDARLAALSDELGSLKTEVKELTETVADNESLTQDTSQGTLENMLFNENMSPFRRQKAFIRLLAMAKNGRVKEKGMKVILQNKEMWLDILDTREDMRLKVVDQKHFDDTLALINRQIYDGAM